MEQYIKKSALVAEIEKLKKSHDNWSCMGKCFHKEYENLLSFLDTLEVKEVDLEKEISDNWGNDYLLGIGFNQYAYIAKHFFELGMQVSNKAQREE